MLIVQQVLSQLINDRLTELLEYHFVIIINNREISLIHVAEYGGTMTLCSALVNDDPYHKWCLP